MAKVYAFEILKNIFRSKVYLSILIIISTMSILIPTIIYKLIIPSFYEQLITNITNSSEKITLHLSKRVDYDKLDEKDTDVYEHLRNDLIDFQVFKAHIFDKDGKIIYSTKKEKIGEFNKHDYFKNIVAKGQIYYKVSKGETQEKEKINIDVFEIYIPVLSKNNEFKYAFELYYDISSKLEDFENLSSNIMKITISSSIFVFALFLFVIYNASKNNLQLKRNEEKLKKLANNDSLTNLFNRRHFYAQANTLLSLANRNNEPTTLCMIDIDNFKMINDTYGHHLGDVVIKNLAKNLKKLTRQTDIVARYGGEEFIILFPNTDINGAKIITKKICKEIFEQELFSKKVDLSYTVSIGVSKYKKGSNIDEFIIDADKALYTAKYNGKNQVVVS